MNKKKALKSPPKIDLKDFGFRIFCYDLFEELLHKYPDHVVEPLFLRIIAADKNPHPLSDSPHPKYKKLFKKYHKPDSKLTILDISLSKVPLAITENEYYTCNLDAERETPFSMGTLMDYKIDKRNLYEIYFENYKNYFPKDDFTYDFFNFISSKVASIQPNVFSPQEYDLWDLNCPKEELFKRKSFGKYMNTLNHIRGELGDGNDAFSQFLKDSFASIKNDLKKMKLVCECKDCNKLFPYVHSKKFCSIKCRDKAARKRYYQKHEDQIKQKQRDEMRETRKLYKQHGIIK